MLVGITKRFKAQCSRFLDDINGFVVLRSRSDAQISRSGYFLADDVNNYLTPCCACVWGNYETNRLLYP